MLKLAEIYLLEEPAEKLLEKLKIYNEKHPEDQLDVQKMAEMLLDYGIRYLDISALD